MPKEPVRPPTTLELLQGILDILRSGSPSNTKTGIIDTIPCPVAQRPYQLPGYNVPDTMALVIKADPTNAVASFIYVSFSKSIDSAHLWPLVPNESMGWRVKNGGMLYISTNVAGSSAIVTVEQR